MNPVHIIFFSGTGGTALAAEILAKEFENRKIPVKRSEIFRNNQLMISQDEFLILMYPVYAGNAPQPVIKYLKTLPVVSFWRSLARKKISDNHAVVISVSGGGDVSPNTACRIKPIRLLKKKGYRVTREYMFCMPSNFLIPTEHDIAVKLIKILPEKCRTVCNEICRDEAETAVINNDQSVHRPYFIDRIVIAGSFMEHIGGKVFGRIMKTDGKCTGCGLCAENCPVGNITMGERRINNTKKTRPLFNWNCSFCMRCIYLCPQKAIYNEYLGFVVLKKGFNISCLKKEADELSLSEGGSRALVLSGGRSKKRASSLWRGVYYYLSDR